MTFHLEQGLFEINLSNSIFFLRVGIKGGVKAADMLALLAEKRHLPRQMPGIRFTFTISGD